MLAEALRLYRISFLRCLPLAALGALLAARAGAYANAQTRAVAGQLSALMDSAVAAPESALVQLAQAAAAWSALWHSPAVWASYLGALLVGLAFHGALIARQDAIADEAATRGHGDRRREDVGRDSAARWLTRTLHRLPSLLVVMVLFVLAAACAALLLAVSGNSLSLALTVGLLLLVATTWLWGRLQLWLVAMFTQELSAVGALRASWNLVGGHWWRVSTLITVPYIAVSLISSLSGALALVDRSASGTVSLYGQALILLSGTLTLPVLPAAWLAIYRELSARRDLKPGDREIGTKKNPAERGVDFDQIAQVRRDGPPT